MVFENVVCKMLAILSWPQYVDRYVDDSVIADTYMLMYPDSKAHGANMGPIWVLLAPGGPHVGPMNLAIRVWAGCSLIPGTGYYWVASFDLILDSSVGLWAGE